MGVGVFLEHDNGVEAQKAPGQGGKPAKDQPIEGVVIGNHEIPALDADGVDESRLTAQRFAL